MVSQNKTNWFKKHKILTVILVLVVLGVVGGAMGGGSTPTADNNKSANSSSSKNKEESMPKIGQAARDGKFEFKVTKIKCGATKVGDQYLNEKAQGQFCRLSLRIENIGNEAQSLFSNDQKLIDSKGREFGAAITSTFFASAGGSRSSCLEEIIPGKSFKGYIIEQSSS